MFDYGLWRNNKKTSLLADTVMELLHTKWTVRTWPSGRRSQDVTTENTTALDVAAKTGHQDTADRMWPPEFGRKDLAARKRPPGCCRHFVAIRTNFDE